MPALRQTRVVFNQELNFIMVPSALIGLVFYFHFAAFQPLVVFKGMVGVSAVSKAFNGLVLVCLQLALVHKFSLHIKQVKRERGRVARLNGEASLLVRRWINLDDFFYCSGLRKSKRP